MQPPHSVNSKDPGQTGVYINYAEGCKLWSSDESGSHAAVQAAQSSDVAAVVVGTWSRGQTELLSSML
jgi:beta-glucosidase